MRRKILGITIVAVMMLSAIVPLVAALSPTVHLQPGICLTDDAKNPPSDARYDRNPSFVVDDTGKYWLFYTRAENANVRGTGTHPDSDEYIIYYLTSEDEGTTWDGPTKLEKSDSKKPANFAQRDVAAIFDPDVAGAKKFFVFAASGYTSGYTNNYIYYYRGNAWNDPVQVIQTPSGNPVVGGHIDVVYRADKQEIWLFYEKGSNGVYAVKSTDHGTTWSNEMFVAKGPTNNYGGVPKAFYADGTLYVVFTDNGAGIYFTKSADNGQTWSDPVLVADDPKYDYDPVIYRAMYPNATDPDAYPVLYVFWAPYDDSNERQWIAYTYSTDDGATWHQAPPIITWGGYNDSAYGGSQNKYWWDFWPELYQDPESGSMLLFYASESNSNGRNMIDGNIWFKNLGILPELTEGVTEDTHRVDTRAEIIGGNNNDPEFKPYVKCKWELSEDDGLREDYDPHISGIQGDADLNNPGLQVDPEKHGNRTIHFYAIVTAPGGPDAIDQVWADVFHPDGTFKYQIELKEKITDKSTAISIFDATKSNPSIVTYNTGHYPNLPGDWEDISRDEVLEELDQGRAYLWHGTADISYCQPAGLYRVDVVAKGFGDWNIWSDSLNNYFWYVPTTAIQIDFTEIDYGDVVPYKWGQGGHGDTDFGTPKPTVRNVGNVPVELYVYQSDMLFGNDVKFRANLGAPLPDRSNVVEYGPNTETRLPGILELCTLEKLDFEIYPMKGQAGDVFTGYMDIIARQHDQPPYQTPGQYIDQIVLDP